MRMSIRFRLVVLGSLIAILAVSLSSAVLGEEIQGPWTIFKVSDEGGVASQDISGDIIVQADGILIRIINLKTGETSILGDFSPCQGPETVNHYPRTVKIEGDWLAIGITCLHPHPDEPLFQTHMYNLDTAESLLLAPDQPKPDHPYSWYADFDNGSVFWSQLTDCWSGGEVYSLDLDTREVITITDGTRASSKQNISVNDTWLAWEEIHQIEGDYMSSVLVYSLNTSETFTITQGLNRSKTPLISGDVIIWNEYAWTNDQRVMVYDLVSGETYSIGDPGLAGYAADVSGNLLIYTERWDSAPEQPSDRAGGWESSPCDFSSAPQGIKKQIRAHDLKTGQDFIIYANSEIRGIYDTRIDQTTAIWTDYQITNNDVLFRTMAARKPPPQAYLPLILH